MAAIKIDEFTYFEGGYDWNIEVFWDPDAFVQIYRTSFPTGSGPISEAQRGYAEDEVFTSVIYNDVQLNFAALLNDPYAYIASSIPDDGCDLEVSAVVQNEEFENDGGSIVVTATSSNLPITYSIDGSNFQSDNEFTGIPAGDYTLYVSDGLGCTQTITFSILSYAPSDNVKYRLDYRNAQNQRCRVDIYYKDFAGEIIPIKGVEGKACIIDYDQSEDLYEPICSSKASISIFQEGQIDILQIQQSNDVDMKIRFYVDGVLKWRGFLVPDGVQQMFEATPYELNLTATDGLRMLDTIDYNHEDLAGGKCLLNYFRQILFANENLGLPLPIRWVNTLTNEEYPLELDVYSGSLRWGMEGEGFTDYNGNPKTCLYILENLLRCMQSRIYQADGMWIIERINDVAGGTYYYRETPPTLLGFTVSDPVMTTAIKTISGISDLSDYSFIEEDATISVDKGLRSVITTYEQDQRDNILPNGNMDIVELRGIGGYMPIYWRKQSGNISGVLSVPSLSAARGNAVTINNDSGFADTFQLENGFISIDSDVLYDYINFGFKFMIETGYVLDGDGYIDWDLTPNTVQVTYYDGTTTYFLNENGFWTITVTNIQISVPNLKPGDVAQIDFNNKQNIILPLPSTIPIERETVPALTVLFNIPNGRKITLDDVYINTGNNSYVYKASTVDNNNKATEEYSLKISSAHNSFYVSNIMSEYNASGIEKFYKDLFYTGTLTAINSHAILRNKSKPSLVFDGSIYGTNWRYGELYHIQTLEGKNFMPIGASWNTETCTIHLTAMEVRDEYTAITMEHYGKNDNDKTLSN